MLRAAHLEHARAIVVTEGLLAERMAICIAARALNPRIAIIVTANNPAERAWLSEFGATFICDTLEPVIDDVMRSVHATL